LISRAQRLHAGFNLLFLAPSGEELKITDSPHRHFLGQYRRALAGLPGELAGLRQDPGLARRCREVVDDAPDSIDHLNAALLLCRQQSPDEVLAACLLDALTAGLLFREESPAAAAADVQLHHHLLHAEQLSRDGIALFRDYLALLEELSADKGPLRLAPGLAVDAAVSRFLPADGGPPTLASIEELRKRAGSVDPFQASRAFRFADGDFFPADLVSIRPVDKFYGFHPARDLFRSYFSAFAAGGGNLPLLIFSLPGLGKTHFTIAHALAHPELTLILPEPGDLERPLEGLLQQLARRRNRRFVLFFDDIDTRKVDWYSFRTHVGGSYVLPENLIIVIASNYEFPANIASRGRGFTFPLFDEISCQEMVLDYLQSLGMRQPPSSLVSVIAADYVEEYGQKLFEELSPRTLVRYLDRYNCDQKKRQRMLDLSREEVTSRPDAQCFYEANQKVLERLSQSR
jgi:hypothetical protein